MGTETSSTSFLVIITLVYIIIQLKVTNCDLQFFIPPAGPGKGGKWPNLRLIFTCIMAMGQGFVRLL